MMKRIVKKRILKIKPYVPGKPIEEVKRALGLRQVIKLASNESPFAPSPKVLKAIAAASKNINRYPESSCYYLRQALAKKLKVSPDQLIFSNGSDEIIILANKAFVNPGDEVVVAKPSFLIYKIASKIEGARVKEVPLEGFRYDLAQMKKAVTRKTKIVFIGNPDNPCGTYVTQKELEKFLKGIRKDIIVFMDEAYFEYVNECDYPDTIKLLKKYKNLIVTRTFSKIYGLAGLRVGYGIASKEMISLLDRVREPFNVNSIAQAAALACLKDQKYCKRLLKRFRVQKQKLYKELEAMGVGYRKTSTNFILIDTKQDSSRVAEKLMRKGVIIRNMAAWGVKNYIRMSVGTEQENKKFIKTLKETL